MKPLDIEEEDEPVAKRPPFLLYGALAVVVLAIIGWLLLRPSSEPAPATATNPQTAPQVVAPAPTVAEKPPAAKPTAARPSGGKPAAAKLAPSSASGAETPGPDRSVWRVVAYTYKGQTKAEDMVAEINGKHADLGAEVFSPPKQSGDYLVTVGGPWIVPRREKCLIKPGAWVCLPTAIYRISPSRGCKKTRR